MPAAHVMGLNSRKRLQGACCFPMDRTSYVKQVADLRAYAAVTEIPSDPYDVQVGLAKRLVRWERTIALTPAQAATYRRAMSMTHQRGPCCCPCWRWHAFRGLSNELIARRRWAAARVARVIDLVEGCGEGRGSMMGQKPSA